MYPGYPPQGQQPQYPGMGQQQQQPGYPPYGAPQPGYAMPGQYPPQQGGMMPQPGYPAMPQQPGYQPMPGYPMQQQPGGYPPQQQQAYPGGYPQQQPYGQQQMPPQQQSYQMPPQQQHQPMMGHAATPGHPETFQISVACRNLRDRDLLGKSDPMCVLYQEGAVGWTELGRTETIQNNLNPSWRHKFLVERRPGVPAPRLKFEVMDSDGTGKNLKRNDFLARLECTLDVIVNAPGMNLVHADVKGAQFVVNAERATADKRVVKIALGARALEKKDTFGKSDPYFVMSTTNPMGQVTRIHQSEVVQNNLNPTWLPFSVSVRKLCNGDFNATLRVDVFDFDANSKHELIGSFSTNLQQLSTAMAQSKTFACVNPSKQSKKNYRSSGDVFVREFQLWEAPNFVDKD